MLGPQGFEVTLMRQKPPVIVDHSINCGALREMLDRGGIARRAAKIERIINHRAPEQHRRQGMPCTQGFGGLG